MHGISALFTVKRESFTKIILINRNESSMMNIKIVPLADKYPYNENMPRGIFHFILKWNNHLYFPFLNPDGEMAQITTFGK